MSKLSNQPLSPLDGRYQAVVSGLGSHLSEAGLNRARILVEVEWIIFLANRNLLGTNTPVDNVAMQQLRDLVANFNDDDILELATTEAQTKHDVKAIEYFIRNRLTSLGRADLLELTHFGCTSEDINNLSYAITIHDAINDVWLPEAKNLIDTIRALALRYQDAAMLARTHGQPATPTTMGKELAVFVHRLERQIQRIEKTEYMGKFSGATGTWSAHLVAAPDVDWFNESKAFVESLGLKFNPLTTQIESHDWQAELYVAVTHFNRILHNLCTDIWTYISMNYFKQIPVAGATGSSTMPHKVNPIRFENAESNLELSNAILDSLANTLVTSRLQRDLTDSSSQRNIGLGLGHSLLALDNVARGLGELELSQPVLEADLAENWEVLAEAVQTVIRAEVAAGKSDISDPYQLLKELTRGRRIANEDLLGFVSNLNISQEAKDRLILLKPNTYTGIASALVRLISEK
ncbi:MAG: adenylosuccinate lyase [Actinobacteria bacterium]|nr:adenylosuccinate lyase [Actinomycetota bacterium]